MSNNLDPYNIIFIISPSIKFHLSMRGRRGWVGRGREGRGRRGREMGQLAPFNN